jgi:dUTP pyrophosphatase
MSRKEDWIYSLYVQHIQAQSKNKNTPMKIKIKKLHSDAVIPSYATSGDAGMDLTAVTAQIDKSGLFIEYGTGIAVEIPRGYVGLLFPRSSLSKTSLVLANHVGVVDSGYRGEVKFRFKELNMSLKQIEPEILKTLQDDRERKGLPLLTGPTESSIWHASESSYEVGDRIGQLVIIPYPQIEFEEVEELSSTERGEGGYGSTGN